MTSGSSVVGAVLAGGLSTRMGRDKAAIQIEGQGQAERVRAALESGGVGDVHFVGGRAEWFGERAHLLVEDRYPDTGPLGAVVTALEAIGPRDWLFVVACDLPHPEARLVRSLLEARTNHSHIVVAHDGTSRQPLFAAYRWSLLPMFRAALLDGERSLLRLAERPDLTVTEVRSEGALGLRDADDPQTLQLLLERPMESDEGQGS